MKIKQTRFRKKYTKNIFHSLTIVTTFDMIEKRSFSNYNNKSSNSTATSYWDTLWSTLLTNWPSSTPI